MSSRLTSNITSTPRKPPKFDSTIVRVLKELLNGGIVNRKNLGEKGIAVTNTSLHSMISALRNEKLAPIMSTPQHDRTCDYNMLPSEITRYNNPRLRQHQKDEMMEHVEIKRKNRLAKNISNYLTRLNDDPKIWQYVPDLLSTLELIVNEINALLTKKKGVN